MIVPSVNQSEHGIVIPIEAQHGMAIQWIGSPYEEPPWGAVHAGDVGTFIDFDGPAGHPEVVVTFPSVGAFVCSSDDVLPVGSDLVEP
jgi:hypothetical protein